jgi:hypothetical protein
MSDKLYVYRDWKGFQVQDLEAFDARARIALEIAKHCSMVAATEDGEDSAGRQQLRLLTPFEVANRAVDIASFMYDRFTALKWIAKVPPFEFEDEPSK